MKDQKVYVNRDLNEEKIENIPQSLKGGVKELDEEFRADGKTIDKEAKKVRRTRPEGPPVKPEVIHPTANLARALKVSRTV